MQRATDARRFLGRLALVLFCFGTSPAGASITFTAVAHTTGGRPLDALLVGDEVTLDIRMSSSGTPGVLSVGAAVHGYDPEVAGFASGEAVSGFLYDLCVPTLGCFEGISNMRAGALGETDFPSSIGRHVRFADGLSLGARTATGDIDPGLDGSVTDAQFRVRFQMLALGSTTLTVGTSPVFGADLYITFADTGGARDQATNAVIVLAVIPEPGTAILLGLGLMALPIVRRRA